MKSEMPLEQLLARWAAAMTDLPQHISDLDVIAQFIAAMREHGIDVDQPIIADGKLHRYHVAGDKGRARNAWAKLVIDEHPAGMYGCNKRFTGEKFTWTMKGARPLTPEERRQIRATAAARAAQRQAEIEMNHANAAARALSLYDAAEPVTGHPYLALKGVPSSAKLRVGKWYWIDEETGEEVVLSENALLVPMMDAALRIHSLQAIFDDGEGRFRKQYLKNGAKEGKFVSLGKPRDNTILIAEGLATGLSLWQCSAHAVVVAFDVGNLIHVAKEMRRVFPEHIILLCADNDAWTHGPKINNPGIHFARAAASAVDGLVAFPEFVNTETKPTDFNDLHRLEGDAAVRECIERALMLPTEAIPATSTGEAIPAAEERDDEQLEGTNNPAIDVLHPVVAQTIRTSPPNVLFLPNDNFASVPVAAERIFSNLASTGEMYRRGNAVAEIKDNRLHVLSPTAFRARLTKRGRKTIAFKLSQHGEVYPAEKHCSEDTARVLLSASEVDLLDEVKLVMSNHVLVEIDGVLILAQ